MIALQKRLASIEELPPIPKTLSEVLHNIDSIATSATTLEAIIKKDPVLAARLLKLANSPFYGLSGKVTSIGKAVVILGFSEVRNLVIGLSLTHSFNQTFKLCEFTANDLWLHSILVAHCAKMLAESVTNVDPDELFTAGLLHDIGRFLIPINFENELEQAVNSLKEGIGLSDAEKRAGIFHGEIGGYLAKKWRLGDLLISTTQYHHDPKGAGRFIREASVVFVSDQLVQKIGGGWDLDYRDGKLTLPKLLGITANDVKVVAKAFKNNLREIRDSWSEILG